MHKTTKTDDDYTINTEHFHNSPSNHTQSADTSNDIERPQKFSFSSSYTASRFNSTSNKFSSTPSATTAEFRFAPLTAFSIVNEDTSYIGKPNAIVRPIRRPELSQILSKSVPENGNHSNNESSHPPINQHTSNPSITLAQNGQNVRQFMDELNRKLRFLDGKENSGASYKKTKNRSLQYANKQETLGKRPLFITTVPTGVFLPPPKELALPATLNRRVYAFSSHPVIFDTDYYHYNYNHNHHYNTNKKHILSKDKPIAGDDKQSSSSINLSHISDIQGHTPVQLTAGVNLTKQQFQQQIRQQRAKRETTVEPYKNIMYDRRIIRGSNFGAAPLLEDSDPFDKAADLRRKYALRKKVCRNQRNVLGTPPPVAGRRHEVIQTEKYLEELVERPPEFCVDTQTDLFLERPPMPPYIPAKVGVDASTEIGEGELFHFDAEAQPIIDILVDACIEQSMLEIAHQQEIEALRQKQEEFLAQREVELAKLRRLEAEEIRLQAEKERRVRQDAIAKKLDEEMQKGVTAAKLLQGHIAGLIPEVLENLEPATDATKKETLMKTVGPWLSAEVAQEVGQIVDSREILTVIIQEIIKQRAEVYADYKEEAVEVEKEPVVGKDENEEEQALECVICETTEESDECSSLKPYP